MSMNRRQVLNQGVALFASSLALSPVSIAREHPRVAALKKSSLIYLSPILSNGSDSKCHGEVWFVYHEDDVIVVTQHNP